MTRTAIAAPADRHHGVGPVTGNVYPKYQTRNPIARRLMAGFLDAFDELLARAEPTDILEIGCGEGYLTTRMASRRDAAGRAPRVRGVDIGRDVLAQAEARAAALSLAIEWQCRSAEELIAPADRAETIVACEVLEHLDRPEEVLDRIAELAERHVLLSVPREPIWRLLNMARGKYLADLGNTPGHVQHWSRKAFVDLVARRFEIVALRTPLPWTMVLCRPR